MCDERFIFLPWKPAVTPSHIAAMARSSQLQTLDYSQDSSFPWKGSRAFPLEGFCGCESPVRRGVGILPPLHGGWSFILNTISALRESLTKLWTDKEDGDTLLNESPTRGVDIVR